MIDFEKPFICNREYIKSEVRDESNFTFDIVREDLFELFKSIPAQKHLPKYHDRVFDIDWKGCNTLYDQVYGLMEYMLCDGEDRDYKNFWLPYISLFLAMKDYSDDELSYLYIVGTEYYNPWNDRDYFDIPQVLLDNFYTGKISRKEVFDVVAYFIVLDMMLSDDPFLNDPYYSLDDYVEE